MGRGKLSMELIMNKKRRNTTYKNRKTGIIKKANELSVLCDVNTLIIFCAPDSNHPEIWCQNPDQINDIISSYKQQKNKNGKRLTYDLDDYFLSRKRQKEDQLIRTREKNREAKYPTWFDNLNGLSEGQLRQFAMGLERKELITKAHLELNKRNLNVQMPFVFDIGNNQLTNDQVQVSDHNVGWSYTGNNRLTDDLVQELMSDDNVVWSDIGNNELTDDLVQALMSDDNVGCSDVYAAGNPYMGLNPSLDQVQDFNHALEWTEDEPTTSFVQLEPEMGISFNHPISEGEVVYDTSKQCEYHAVQQCCPVSDDEPTTSFVQLEPEMVISLDYPVFEGEYQPVQVEPQMGIRFNYSVSDDKPTTSSVQEMGIKLDHPVSKGEVVNETCEPCECEEVEKCCAMAEKSGLEKADVNDDGVGIEEFVIDDDLSFLKDMDLDDDSMIEFVTEDDLGLFMD